MFSIMLSNGSLDFVTLKTENNATGVTVFDIQRILSYVTIHLIVPYALQHSKASKQM